MCINGDQIGVDPSSDCVKYLRILGVLAYAFDDRFILLDPPIWLHRSYLCPLFVQLEVPKHFIG